MVNSWGRILYPLKRIACSELKEPEISMTNGSTHNAANRVINTCLLYTSTVSYAFATRFPSELFEEIFAWVLEAAVERKFVEAKRVFIDATHIKASANRKKHRKVLAQHTACVYDDQLRAEIDADRAAHGKKPLKDDDHDDEPKHGSGRMAKESTSDPESGLFVKSDHKVEFAYTAYVSCDEHNLSLIHI